MKTYHFQVPNSSDGDIMKTEIQALLDVWPKFMFSICKWHNGVTLVILLELYKEHI